MIASLNFASFGLTLLKVDVRILQALLRQRSHNYEEVASTSGSCTEHDFGGEWNING